MNNFINLALPLFNMLVFVALISGWRFSKPTDLGDAQEGKRTLRAERFELVDKDSKTCGVFAVDDAQRPVLKLGGKKGEGAALLAIEADGAASLRLMDQNGKSRLMLSIGKEGSPFIALSDANSNMRVFLDAPEGGAVGFQLLDKNQVIRSSLLLDPDGNPSLSLFDGNKTVRAIVSSKQQSQLLWLFDKDGKIVWQTP